MFIQISVAMWIWLLDCVTNFVEPSTAIVFYGLFVELIISIVFLWIAGKHGMQDQQEVKLVPVFFL